MSLKVVGGLIRGCLIVMMLSLEAVVSETRRIFR